MSRFKEILYALGYGILLPRFCLFVLLPCLLFAGYPFPPAISWLMQHGKGEVILGVCVSLFALGVASNLSLSRYLRIHHTLHSPYHYAADSGIISFYFRILVTDDAAFKRLIQELRHRNRWYGIDEYLFRLVAVLGFLLFGVIFGVPLLIRLGWLWITNRRRANDVIADYKRKYWSQPEGTTITPGAIS